MTELLQQLIDLLKGASPLVWAAYMKQVYVYAGQQAAWAVLLLILILFIVKAGDFCKKFEEDLEWFFYFGAVLLGVLSFMLITRAVGSVINPEYYAIQNIINQLR